MAFALKTIEPTRFGSGWISGVFSAGFGVIGLGAVLCFLFPSLLTTPEARALYPLPYVRALLHLVLVAAFVLGCISLSLRRNKALGTVGVAAALLAVLLGGSRVEVDDELARGPFLGLDWFILNLIFYSLLFVPLERLFARLPDQAIFRRDWRTDLTYLPPRWPSAYGISHGAPPPQGYLRQLVWPLRAARSRQNTTPTRTVDRHVLLISSPIDP